MDLRLAVPLLLLLSVTSWSSAIAQQTSTQDPQAVTLATQSYLALTGGAAIHDVTLTGTERLIAGSLDETEPVTMMAMGTDNGRIDRSTSHASEVRTTLSSGPAGIWIGTDGVSHEMSSHNCWTDASWFFPAFLSVYSTAQNTQLRYVGMESLDGISVQHIRASKIFNELTGKPDAGIIQLSQMDIYLDAQSLLPVAVEFEIHPDRDSSTNIPIEVSFSDYRVVNGIQVPFHIQKYIQNGLYLDIVVSGVTFNSGLTTSSFQAQ